MSPPTLTPIAAQLWSIDQQLTVAPGVQLPIRTTVLRDADGSVTVISPVGGVADWGPRVAQLGPVARIIAPNAYHHLFALPAAEHFAQAELLASAALRNKRKDFPQRTRWLAGPGPLELSADLQAYLVAGLASQEWLLLHRPSGALVVTDLLFHVLQPGFGLGLLNRLTGTYKQLAVSRLFLRDRRDKAAYAASVEAVAALPFERLVMAHGEPVLAGAQPLVRAALLRSL